MERGERVNGMLAGHNGSGKSTFWYHLLADMLEMPLVNADRMILLIPPEPDASGAVRDWALPQEWRDVNLVQSGEASQPPGHGALFSADD